MTVREELLRPETEFLQLIECDDGGISAVSYAQDNRARIAEALVRYGAVLLRGFEMGPDRFRDVVDALSTNDRPMRYVGGTSPRVEVGRDIYLSTTVPQASRMLHHQEMSYLGTWPMRVYFCADIVAATGGETPICDARRVTQRLDPEVIRRFSDEGVLYIRNYANYEASLGFANLDWRSVFETTDAAVAEAACSSAGMAFEWLDGGERLRTKHRAQGVARHPKTGELLWFNQAHNVNWYSGQAGRLTPLLVELAHIPLEVRERISSMERDDLVYAAAWGDGESISLSILEEINGVLREEEELIAWRSGDVLILDNMRTTHAREPFTGDRRLLAALTEPLRNGVSAHEREGLAEELGP